MEHEDFFHGHPRFYQLTREEVDLHSRKNYDYAGGGDPLGNFKRVSALLSQYPNLDCSNPVLVAIIYAIKQLDAVLWMLSRGFEGEIEGIGTRLADIYVYMKLARILWEEQHGEDEADL